MSRRTTIKLSELIDRANSYLAVSPPVMRNERLGVQDFISSRLHEANVYAGFGYVQPYGSPGSDETRIFFYKHWALRTPSSTKGA